MEHSLAGLITNRLILHPLNINDHLFILELVNTPGWLQFIGDLNVRDQTDAEGYINKILDNPNAFYWVAKLKITYEALGVITFLKRNYLENYDVGFAFLPDYNRQGYAYEAATAVINHFSKQRGLKQIKAISIPSNVSSVRLLAKLGFAFEKVMQIDNKSVSVYNLVIS